MKPEFVPDEWPTSSLMSVTAIIAHVRAIEAHLAAQNPPGEPVDMRDRVSISREMLNFLTGIGSLEGLWFGDRSPHRKGAWWWRSLLRNDTLRTSAGEVPDEIVPRPFSRPHVDIAGLLRAHNMKIVYREGPK